MSRRPFGNSATRDLKILISISLPDFPGQTLDGWQRNVEQALQLRPEHLSLYLLDVHEGTPLADQIKRGMRPKPDDDLAAEMYSTMIETVRAAGYEHYEISNFCFAGI
jgi:oxygen-independent coproporphyrinogen-3 oxidase